MYDFDDVLSALCKFFGIILAIVSIVYAVKSNITSTDVERMTELKTTVETMKNENGEFNLNEIFEEQELEQENQTQ